MGEEEEGAGSKWKLTMIKLECRGSGLCDSSSGSQTLGHRAEADWRVAGRSRGASEWIFKERSVGKRVGKSAWGPGVINLVEASNHPMERRCPTFCGCRSSD